LPSAQTLYRISRHSLSGNKKLAATRHWANLSLIEPHLPRRIANYLFYSVAASFFFTARRVPCIMCSATEEYLDELQRQVNRVVDSEDSDSRL
jgi:hypothetical protein